MFSARVRVEDEMVALVARAGRADGVEMDCRCAAVVGEDRVDDLHVRGGLGQDDRAAVRAEPVVDDRAVGDDRPAPRRASARAVELEGEAVIHLEGEHVQEQDAALAVQVEAVAARTAAARGGDVVDHPVHEGEGPARP